LKGDLGTGQEEQPVGESKASIDFREFLFAAIDYMDQDRFMSYMQQAYLLFFNNADEAFDTQDMIDDLCNDRKIENKLVNTLIN